MLDVAAATRSDIEWRHGDAAHLPFGDGEFDAVLCRSALFFFPDVDAAVAEMARVARARRSDRCPDVRQPRRAAWLPRAGWSRPSDRGCRCSATTGHVLVAGRPILCKTLTGAGLDIVETRTILGTAMYGSVENLIETEVKGTPLADRLSDDQIGKILAESTGVFAKFLTPAGKLEMPIRAHLVMGHKQLL